MHPSYFARSLELWLYTFLHKIKKAIDVAFSLAVKIQLEFGTCYLEVFDLFVSFLITCFDKRNLFGHDYKFLFNIILILFFYLSNFA